MSVGLELPTRQINVSYTVKNDLGTGQTDIKTVSCPDRISNALDLIFLGEQLIARMCEKHHEHELSFHLSFRDIIVPAVGSHLVWYPENAWPKPMFKWTPEEVVTAVVMNSFCLVVEEWKDILTAVRQEDDPKQRAIRCHSIADDATITVHVGFRRKYHPHKLLRRDLVN